MQHFKALRTRTKFAISSILGLCFALFTFGCEADKNISDFSVIAEGTPEGILLHFDNISQDATWLAVTFVDVTTDDVFYNQFEYSDICFDKDGINFNELAKLRESNDSQNFLCPFVVKGHEYRIIIHYDDNDFNLNVVAGGGISLINEPWLYFNDENNGLILSEKPVFSDDVLYSQDDLSFKYVCVGVRPDRKINEYPFFGCVSSITNDLVCDVSDIYNEYNQNQELRGLTKNENYSLIGAVYCFVDYDNFTWEVKATRTEEVVFVPLSK